MALYDVVGKALGVPAYRLFNLPKARDWCPISWWNIDMPPEAFAEEAKEALAKGYTSYKIKARPWWDVYEQVDAISRVTPPWFRLDLDWTVLKKMLEEGRAETRPGFNLEYCLRTGTAYFAWFFEGERPTRRSLVGALIAVAGVVGLTVNR